MLNCHLARGLSRAPFCPISRSKRVSKLNLKKLRSRLSTCIRLIICCFTSSLDVLEEFIIYATKELSVELTEEDYEGLLQVMRVLNEVRAKQDAGTDQMFEPLRDIIDVLKEYGVDFPEETYEQVCIAFK